VVSPGQRRSSKHVASMFLGCSLLVPSFSSPSLLPPTPSIPPTTGPEFTDAGRIAKVTTAFRAWRGATPPSHHPQKMAITQPRLARHEPPCEHASKPASPHRRPLLHCRPRNHSSHSGSCFNKYSRRSKIDTIRKVIPGFGDINWGKYIGHLREVGYKGVLSIEHEDSTFGPEEGFRHGAQYLSQYCKA